MRNSFQSPGKESESLVNNNDIWQRNLNASVVLTKTLDLKSLDLKSGIKNQQLRLQERD